MLPAVGQGALGIECRSDDIKTKEIISFLNHDITSLCVLAERSMNALLGGSCQLPVAGHAEFTRDNEADPRNSKQQMLHLRGIVAEPDGSKILRAEAKQIIKNSEDAEKLGVQVAQLLFEQDAQNIIDKYKS